ncbi:MAG TPA: ABC transporter permease [Bryobacteraceae bacterium]|jgi:predicted permease
MSSDVKYAVRLFRRSPGFTLTAVAALALGIGVNTAVFSVVNSVLLRPIAAPDPDHVVVFGTVRPNGPPLGASITRYLVWRQLGDVFENVSAYRFGTMDLTAVDKPQQVQMAQVSESYFRLFGLAAARGATFSPAQDQPNAGHFVVLSDGFWKRAFDRDPGILGKAISLSGSPYTVIGVLGADAVTESPRPVDVFVPFQIPSDSTDQNHFFTAAGRLRSGVTRGTIDARLAQATADFRRRFPNVSTMLPGYAFGVQPIRETIGRDIRKPLLVLSGAVALVLLIACANVANLLLMRAAGRRREIAIRSAAGASRAQIMRQLLTESMLLAMTGGVAGLIVGLAGVRALTAWNPVYVPGLQSAVEWRVAAFALAISLVTGVVFGLAPAIGSSRIRLDLALKENGGYAGTGFRQKRLRGLLVVSEVALAVMLVIGSGLLIRTFAVMRSANLGFTPSNVLMMDLSLAGDHYEKSANVTQLARTTIERIAAIAGVETVAVGCCPPVGPVPNGPYYIPGRPVNGNFHGRANYPVVSPDYFRVFQIPIVEGRGFTENDNAGAPLVAIINQTMARKFWPNGGAVGHLLGTTADSKDPPAEIIGVAGDTGDRTSLKDFEIVYFPLAQISDAYIGYLNRMPTKWMIRTRSGAGSAALTQNIRRELERASGLPVEAVHSMDELLDQSTAAQDFNLVLMLIFGVSALVLAAVGIYGVLSYSVEQRRREIGIRLALGGEPGGIRAFVFREGMRLAMTGTAIGIGAAVVFVRWIESLLVGVEPYDGITFLAAPAVLALVAGAAVWLPAIRASRIDPMIALRYE